jgi:hypothetical protein
VIRHLVDHGRGDFVLLANRPFRVVENIFHKGIKMRGILFDLWLVQASSRQACETTDGRLAQANMLVKIAFADLGIKCGFLLLLRGRSRRLSKRREQ